MAKIFLDANRIIDWIEKRTPQERIDLESHNFFLSPLSIHILMYIAKKRLPYPDLMEMLEQFTIVDFDQSIFNKALEGPTSDFEDNVQLHSAAQAECDLFLTSDKQLLNLKFFGTTEITLTPGV